MTDVRTIAALSNTAARRLVDAALAAAARTDQKATSAVVDAAGHLNAFARMDGAPVLTIQIAVDKAYTAAGFGLATGAWHDLIREDAPLALGAPAQISRLISFGGGLPILARGELIGGIGVSGGHWSDDTRIAEAALAAG
jgi:uncharacterized protein GlcG (DUF336 family)